MGSVSIMPYIPWLSRNINQNLTKPPTNHPNHNTSRLLSPTHSCNTTLTIWYRRQSAAVATETNYI